MRLLVVEDEQRLAAGLRKGLEAEGFAVDVVYNGTDALWMARENPFDAIVLDVMLPGANGYQVCRTLRSESNWTPILMLTAKVGVWDEVEGLDTGADDYLAKPFSYAVLVARLRALLRRGARPRPTVLEVAKENAALAGIAAQYRTIPGSAFDVDYGTGYDLVLLSNFLHHFNPETIHHLLTKVHAALGPGGRAVTVEFIPNDDRISPPDSATFSLVMLAATPAGDAYTFAELDKMFRDAGFRSSEKHALLPSPAHMVISRK